MAGAGQSAMPVQGFVHSDACPKLWQRHESHVVSPVQTSRKPMVPGAVQTVASGRNGRGSFPQANSTTAVNQASSRAMREVTAR
jgi:hypothetical protein